MKKGIYISGAIAILFAVTAAAPMAVYKVSKGAIQFKSDAPLELIKASSDELAGLFDSDKKMFAFRIKVNTFKGFNGLLQKEHFNENYMETAKFPYASFEGKIIEDIDYSNPGTYNVRAKGNLTVHGVTQERIIKIILEVKKKLVTASSEFTVLLADHNITIPKVVHEKLASEIKVSVTAELTTP
jgi:polyisoprenoid-binding protein YceI